MKKKFAEKQRSFTFQKRIEDRAKLPIFNKKHEILDIIRDNPVVIVQGGTGCGKTTQVSVHFIMFLSYYIIMVENVGLPIYT